MAKRPNHDQTSETEQASETEHTIDETAPVDAPVHYTETALSVASDDDMVRAADGTVFRVKKRVAMPVLQFRDGMTIVCRFMTAAHQGKVVVEDGKGKAKMETPHVCEISSLSGEMRTLIMSTVLMKELSEAYPGDGYVGAWFHITRLAPRPDKRYATFVINEIEPPTEAQKQAVREANDPKQIAA
jgi:hypothetical protein